MGIRELIILLLGLATIAVILRGLSVAISARRGQLRMAIDKNIPMDVDLDSLEMAELPSGGARVVGRGLDAVNSRNVAVEAANARAEALALGKNTEGETEPVPVLMDAVEIRATRRRETMPAADNTDSAVHELDWEQEQRENADDILLDYGELSGARVVGGEQEFKPENRKENSEEDRDENRDEEGADCYNDDYAELMRDGGVTPINLDHPQPDYPQPDHPQSDHPQSDHPQSDHPQSDHPQPDYPQSDHPQSDYPQEETQEEAGEELQEDAGETVGEDWQAGHETPSRDGCREDYSGRVEPEYDEADYVKYEDYEDYEEGSDEAIDGLAWENRETQEHRTTAEQNESREERQEPVADDPSGFEAGLDEFSMTAGERIGYGGPKPAGAQRAGLFERAGVENDAARPRRKSLFAALGRGKLTDRKQEQALQEEPGVGPAAREALAAVDTAAAPQAASSAATQEDFQHAEVIVLNVTAQEGRRFAGDDLLQVLITAGLKFGDMKLFHRRLANDDTGPVVFSVANILNPGTFDLDTMNGFTTPGISLFLALPSSLNNLDAFEQMLAVAQQLRGALDGELKDDHRNVMTAQTIEHYRQRIRDFELRQLKTAGARA